MKISQVIFKGDKESQNTYQLALEQSQYDTTRQIVIVLRNFKGDVNNQDRVPSGWYFSNVYGLEKLCIDGGTNWFVFPTKEAWADLLTLV